MYYNNIITEEEIDYAKAVRISENVYWVGHYDKKSDFQCNTYLVIVDGIGIVIDPGSVITTEIVLNKIRQIIPLAAVNYIFVSHQDPDVCGNIDDVLEAIKDEGNENCTVVTHQRTATFLVHIIDKFRIINSNLLPESTLKINKYEFRFIDTPYLHAPGSIVVYYKNEKILFSSDLFGGFTKNWQLFAGTDYIENIITFHQQYMPSKEILMYGMTRIEKLDIKMIAPQHGSVIPQILAKQIINQFKNFECGLLIDEDFRNELRSAKNKIELQNRIMKEELLMASNFQKSLLPPVHFTSFENEIMMSYHTRPQFSVSGDFVIIDQIDKNNLAVMIIDVVGHGVTAGLATIQVKTLFDSLKFILEPTIILREINRRAFNIVDNSSYFTALLCVFNAENSSVKIASAAGIPPLFFDGQTREHKVLNLSGTPVGMSDDEEFNIGEIELMLKSNDTLILQTDGLIEAVNSQNIQFDNALTQENISKAIDPKDYPKIIIEKIIKNVVKYTGEKKFQDDITIAAIKKL